MNHPRMIEKMTAFYRGSTHDAAHFLKVYALAAAIGRLEGLPEDIRKQIAPYRLARIVRVSADETARA